jgi:hypothetical protein
MKINLFVKTIMLKNKLINHGAIVVVFLVGGDNNNNNLYLFFYLIDDSKFTLILEVTKTKWFL